MTAWPDGGLVLACESGVTDAAYANARADAIDAVALGGIAVDRPTRRAARGLVAREREEFLPDDPLALIDAWLTALDDDVAAAVNVRAASSAATRRVAGLCADHGAAVEINAHCRQPEMIERGCGHALLRDREALAERVRAAAQTEATVAVKTRAAVVDDAAVARRVAAAGGDAIHVDCMDTPSGIDAVVEAAPELTVVANNGVRTPADARRYLGRGADAVSTARGGRDVATLHGIRRGLEARC